MSAIFLYFWKYSNTLTKLVLVQKEVMPYLSLNYVVSPKCAVDKRMYSEVLNTIARRLEIITLKQTQQKKRKNEAQIVLHINVWPLCFGYHVFIFNVKQLYPCV